MSFKFTLLGIEFEKDKSVKKVCTKNVYHKNSNTMARRKLTKQQRKFIKAQASCHNITKSPRQFGNCMRGKLKK